MFLGPVHRYRAGGRVHRDTAPTIRCIHWRLSTKTFVKSSVRTTTTTSVAILAEVGTVCRGSGLGPFALSAVFKCTLFIHCCTGARAYTAWFRFVSSCALLFCRRNWLVRNSGTRTQGWRPFPGKSLCCLRRSCRRLSPCVRQRRRWSIRRLESIMWLGQV